VKLRCEPNSTFYSHSAAYTGVTKTGNTKWAQTGYIRRRYAGSSTVYWRVYHEVKAGPNPADYHFSFKGSAPGAGSHSYQDWLNQGAGKWYAYYDGGSPWDTFTHAGWKNDTGDYVQYAGEINIKESDLVGTADSKCRFASCQYRTAGNPWTDANIGDADCHTSDSKEWGITRVSGTAFDIWDVNPLP
jgi:hypothetical protein